jgi:hypothetical protein
MAALVRYRLLQDFATTYNYRVTNQRWLILAIDLSTPITTYLIIIGVDAATVSIVSCSAE